MQPATGSATKLLQCSGRCTNNPVPCRQHKASASDMACKLLPCWPAQQQKATLQSKVKQTNRSPSTVHPTAIWHVHCGRQRRRTVSSSTAADRLLGSGRRRDKCVGMARHNKAKASVVATQSVSRQLQTVNSSSRCSRNTPSQPGPFGVQEHLRPHQEAAPAAPSRHAAPFTHAYVLLSLSRANSPQAMAQLSITTSTRHCMCAPGVNATQRSPA